MRPWLIDGLIGESIRWLMGWRHLTQMFTAKMSASRRPNALQQQRAILQLATLINAGIALHQALSLLICQQPKPQQHYWRAIQQGIEQGHSLSQSLTEGSDFALHDIMLLTVAERSGRLASQLQSLALLQAKRLHRYAQVRRALSYPCLILFGALAVSAFLLIQVVPSFASLYHGFGAELPWLTQYILDLSASLQRYGLALLAVLLIILSTALLCWHKSTRWRCRVYALCWRLPVIKGVLQAHCLGLWHRTLAESLHAGLSFIESLQLSAALVAESPLAPCQLRLQNAINNGQRLSLALQEETNYPALCVQMIATGEESGMLVVLLQTLAEQFEQDLDCRCEQALKLLEPVLMSFLGILVGIIVMALYLPLFQLGQVI